MNRRGFIKGAMAVLAGVTVGLPQKDRLAPGIRGFYFDKDTTFVYPPPTGADFVEAFDPAFVGVDRSMTGDMTMMCLLSVGSEPEWLEFFKGGWTPVHYNLQLNDGQGPQ